MSEFAQLLTVFLAFGCGPPLPLPMCTCGIERIGNDPVELVHWSERDVIFVGHALEVDPAPTPGIRQRVRFLVEASWRGEQLDTVTLLLGDNAPCYEYYAGGRYLVIADGRASAGQPLTSAQCDFPWQLSFPNARKMLAELDPADQREVDLATRAAQFGAVPTGKSPTPAPDTVRIGVSFLSDEQPTRYQIADHGWKDAGRTLTLWLPKGLYQIKLQWEDGRTKETYISARCDSLAEQHCYAFRYLVGHRAPLPNAG